MKCLDYAMKYIYQFPKTEQELRIRLYQKGYTTEEVKKTMDILKSKKFLDDEMFTESYIRSEVVNKGKPSLLISKKLEFKGVDKKIIDKVLKKYSEDMADGIHEKIKKEIAAYKRKGVEGFEIIQKILRKGYKLDDIKDVINNK